MLTINFLFILIIYLTLVLPFFSKRKMNSTIVLVISELSVELSLDISDLCPFVMSHCLYDIQLCTLNVYKYVLHM